MSLFRFLRRGLAPGLAGALALAGLLESPAAQAALQGPTNSLPGDSPWYLNSGSPKYEEPNLPQGHDGGMGKTDGGIFTQSYSSVQPAKVYWGITSAGFSLDGNEVDGAEWLQLHTTEADITNCWPGGTAFFLGTTSISYEDGGWMPWGWNYWWVQNESVLVRLRMEATLDDLKTKVPMVRGDSVGASAPVVVPMEAGKSYRIALYLEVFAKPFEQRFLYVEPFWQPALIWFNAHNNHFNKTYYHVNAGYFYQRGPQPNITLNPCSIRENTFGAVKIGNLSCNSADSDPAALKYELLYDPTGFLTISGNELWAGGGFKGEYNWGPNWGDWLGNHQDSGRSGTRTDPVIDFSWGSGSPWPWAPSDCLSFKWTGQVAAPKDGWYRFRTISDDGVALWINDEPVINNPTDHGDAVNESRDLYFKAGQVVRILMRGYERYGNATMKLQWLQPGETAWKPVPGGGAGSMFNYEQTNQFNNIKIRATDNLGLSCTYDVGVRVEDVNELPVVLKTIPGQSFKEDFSNKWVLDLEGANWFFSDPEGKPMTYTIDLSPEGIVGCTKLNRSQFEFSSQPDANGTVTVTVKARDDISQEASTQFIITVEPAPDAPRLKRPSETVAGPEDHFYFTRNLNDYFWDPDGSLADHPLTYEVIGIFFPDKTESSPIARAWVQKSQLVAYGFPDSWGKADLKVKATDPGNLSTAFTFRLDITNVNDRPEITRGPVGGALRRRLYYNLPGWTCNDLWSAAAYKNTQPDWTGWLPGGFDTRVRDSLGGNYYDNYGQVLDGYLRPPITGKYRFWIASDDASQLALSTDEQPANSRKIASVDSWTTPRQWDKEANQQSAGIELKAGQDYYVVACMKEAGGDDHLEVKWQRPDGVVEDPIPARFLRPYLRPDGGPEPAAGLPRLTTINPTDGLLTVETNEDCGAVVIDQWVSGIWKGGWGEVQTLDTETKSNSNPGLFSSPPGLTLSANSETAKLSFQPAENQNGEALVSFRIHNSGGADNGAANAVDIGPIRIVVKSVNDPPRCDGLADQSVDEQPDPNTLATSLIQVAVAGIDGGPNEPNDTVTVSAVVVANYPPGLVVYDHAAPVAGGKSAVYFRLGPYLNGSADLKVVLKDSASAITEKPFKLTVKAVDHCPVLATNLPPVALQEDDPPRAIRLENVFRDLDGDPFDILSLESSDASQVKLAAELFREDDPKTTFLRGKLVLTPRPNQFTITSGTNLADQPITLTLTATAKSKSVSTSFPVTIQEVNDPPTLDPISTVVTDDSYAYTRVLLTGLGPGPLEAGFDAVDPGSFGFTSSNPAAIPASQMLITNLDLAAGTAQLWFKPNVLPAGGTAILSVSVGDRRGGRTTNYFNAHISHVNHAPRLATNLPPAFAGAPLTGARRPTLRLLEDSGATRVDVSGLFADPDGDSVAVTLFGNTNSALVSAWFTNAPNVLVLRPAADQFGRSELTLRGADGLQEDYFTFAVEVAPVNDPPGFDPIVRQRVDEDSGPQTVAITGLKTGPANEAGQRFQAFSATILEQSSSNLIARLEVDSSLLNTNPIPPATWLRFTAGASQSGTARIRVTLRDDGGATDGGDDSFSREFEILVDPVAHPPRLLATNLALTFTEDQFAAAGGVTVVAITNLFENPENPALPPELVLGEITDPNEVLANEQPGGVRVPPAAPQTVQLTFNADAFGTAQIRLRGFANGLLSGASAMLTVVVLPVNDPPQADPIPDQAIPQGPASIQRQVTVRGIRPGPPNESGQAITNLAAQIVGQTVPGLIVIDEARLAGGTNAVLKYHAGEYLAGQAILRVTLADDGGSSQGGTNAASFDFLVLVTPVDTRPVLAGPPPVREFLEDQFALAGGTTAVDLAGLFKDPAGRPVQLEIREISDPGDLLDPAGVSIDPALPERLRLKFNADANGVADIALGARAGAEVSEASGIFRVRVLAVNDPPTFAAPLPLTVESGSVSNVVNILDLNPGPREALQQITNLAARVLSETTNGLVSILSPVRFNPGSTAGQILLSAATNRSGAATIRLEARDDGGAAHGGLDLAARDFSVTVKAADQPPRLVKAASFLKYDESGLATNPVQTFCLTGVFADPEGAPVTLLAESIDNLDGILQDIPVRFLPNAPEYLELAFNPHTSGRAVVQVRAVARRLASARTHTVNIEVTPVNDRPTLDPIPRQTVPMNSGAHALELTGISGGINEMGQPVTVTAVVLTNPVPGLIQEVVVDHQGSNSIATLRYAVLDGAKGVAALRVTVSDGTLQSSRDFRIQVVGGGEPPERFRAAQTVRVLEDQFAPANQVGSLDLRGLFIDPQGNPVELIVDAQSIRDPDGTLDREAGLPRAGPGQGEYLRCQFRPDRNGAAEFDVRAMAAGLLSTNAAHITAVVLPVNDPPAVERPPDITVPENTPIPEVVVKLGPAGPEGDPAERTQRITNVVASLADAASARLLETNITVVFTPGEDRAVLRLESRPNQNGVAYVEVAVRDDGGTANGGQDTASVVFAVKVTAVDQPPTVVAGREKWSISWASDSLEAWAYWPKIPLTGLFADPDGDPVTLVVQARRNRDGVLDEARPDAIRIEPATADSPEALRLRLQTNVFGILELDLVALANGAFSTNGSTLTVEVTPPKGAPSFNAVANLSVLESQPVPDIKLSGLRPGAAASGASAITHIEARVVSASPPDLISQAVVTRGADPAAAALALVPTAGRAGSAILAVRVTDNGAVSAERTNAFERQFKFTAVNMDQLPKAVTNRIVFACLEDQFAAVGGMTRLDLRGLFIDPEGEPLALRIVRVQDAGGLLATNLVYVDPLNPESLVVGFGAEASGEADLWVQAVAGGLPSADSATVHFLVRPVNDPPRLEAPAAVVVTNLAPWLAIPLAGIRPGPAAESGQMVTNLTAEVVSQDPAGLLRVAGLDYVAGQASGLLRLAVSANALAGRALIKLTLRDNGGTADGGADSASVQFSVAVNIARQAPELVAPIGARRISEDSTNLLAVSLAGVFKSQFGEPPALSITSVTDPDDILADEAPGGVVLLNGSAPALQARLRADAFGTATISCRALAGGIFSTNDDTLTIIVDPVNDPPAFSLPATLRLAQGASHAAFNITGLNVGPREAGSQAIKKVEVAIATSQPSDLLAGLPVVSLDLKASQAAVTLPLNPGRSGQARLSVKVQDDGGVDALRGGVDTTVKELVLTVTPVDHPPLLVAPAGSTNLSLAAVAQLGATPLLVKLEGRFVDPDGDPVTCFVVDVRDPDDVLQNETAGGLAVVTNQAAQYLSLLLRTNQAGAASVEYLAVANGQVSTNTDTVTVVVSAAGRPPRPAPVAAQPAGSRLLLGGAAEIGGNLVAFPAGGLARAGARLRWEVCGNDLWLGAHPWEPPAAAADQILPPGGGWVVPVAPELAGRFIRAVAVEPAGSGGSSIAQEYASPIRLVGRVAATFDEWLCQRLGQPSPTPPGAAGDDPDGDGLANIVEYAFGLDPLQADASPWFVWPDRGEDGLGQVNWVFPAMKNRPDVLFELQTSTDLVHWSTASAPAAVLEESEHASLLAYSFATETKGCYWRLRVRQLPAASPGK